MDDAGLTEVSFLLHKDEISKHESILKDLKNALQKKSDLEHKAFEQMVIKEKWDKRYAEASGIVKKLNRDIHIIEVKSEKLEQEAEGLRSKVENLKPLATEKQDDMLQLAQELEKLKMEEQEIKQSSESIMAEMKDKFHSVVVGKEFYKKRLSAHLRCTKSDESGVVIIFTFNSSVKPSEDGSMPKGSVKLFHNPSNKSWRLLETNPSLPRFKQLAQKLESTGDVRGLLAFLRSEWKGARH